MHIQFAKNYERAKKPFKIINFNIFYFKIKRLSPKRLRPWIWVNYLLLELSLEINSLVWFGLTEVFSSLLEWNLKEESHNDIYCFILNANFKKVIHQFSKFPVFNKINQEWHTASWNLTIISFAFIAVECSDLGNMNSFFPCFTEVWFKCLMNGIYLGWITWFSKVYNVII